jgi:regulatory protein
MRRHGLPVELVDEILQHVSEEFDEIEQLRSAIDRRYPGFVFNASSDKEKRRVVSWLQRHGFGISAVMRVLRETV